MFKKTATLVLIAAIISASLIVLQSVPTVAAWTEPSGRKNGLTLDLSATYMYQWTVAEIVDYMADYHLNAIKVYSGWCAGYWGTTWTGDVDDPIPTATKTKLSDLFSEAADHNWYIICTISDQVTPANTNDTWHDYEVQVGWEGPNSDLNTQDNWCDYTGPQFKRHQTALVTTFVDLMDDYVTPRIGMEEFQYVSGGGHPAFYAQSLKDAYYADTGLEIPYFASTSTTWSGMTTAQRNFINYVNATIRDFYEDMMEAALAENSTTKFHVMTDNLYYYQTAMPFIYLTQPFDFFGNSTAFEATEIEAYGYVGSSNWAGLENVLDMCTSWNPEAEHFFTYGYFSGGSASENLIAVEQAMDNGYDGVWAYSLASSTSNFGANPLDVSDLIPTTAYANVAYSTTAAGTSCQFSSYWTDSAGLAGAIASYNGTGSWVNETWATMGSATAAWSNFSKTLPASGTVVGYRWFVNNTDAYWTETPIYTLTTTGESVNFVVLSTPSSGYSSYNKTITFTYTPVLFQAIENSSVWINITGTWQNVANNASAVTNDTVNSISYSFTASGTFVWNVKVFNSTHAISAPSNYTITMSVGPYFGTISTNTTYVSQPCLFDAYVYDGNALDTAFLCTNVSGSMVNETGYWAFLGAASGHINWTVTLPATYGAFITYRLYINDTDGNGAVSSDYTFQLDTTVINIIIVNPVVTTYASSSINVTISATIVGGTIDKRMYNVLNGSNWVYPANQTYTASVMITGFVTGTYELFVYVNATDGTLNSTSVAFYVSIPATGHPAFRITSSSGIVISDVIFTNFAIGIQLDGSGSDDEFYGNNMTGCTWKFVWNGTVTAIIHDNFGYNPVGIIAASVSVSGNYLVDSGSTPIQSGINYTCTQSCKIIYISGTVSTIRINGIVVFAGEVNVAIPLRQNDVFMIEWETQPMMSVMVQ